MTGTVASDPVSPLASWGAGSSFVADPRALLRTRHPLPLAAGDVDPDTMVGVVAREAERFGRRLAVTVERQRRWFPVAWDELFAAIVAFAAGLVHHGVAPQERVAILTENRLEWLWTDFGTQAARAVLVPIYASSTAETVRQILVDSGAVAVVCSTPAQAAKVQEIVAACPDVRLRLLFEGSAEGFVSPAEFVAGVNSADMSVLADRMRSVRPQDMLTIVYTSGTTGVPKGVVLTHRNVVSSCRSILQVVRIGDDDHGLSLLPWAHVFERVQGIFAGMTAGVTAAVAEDLDDVAGALRSQRPTLLNAVPRLYEKMQEAIVARIRSQGGWRAAIGMRALDDCIEEARLRRRGQRVPSGLRLRCAVWRRLVIEPIRQALGGRPRIFTSGGGPINIATLEFFDGLGIAIVEGYGLTETSGGIAVNPPENPRFGTVGRAIPEHEIRIAEDGEILVRGPAVMEGYFRNPEATAEVMRDGWFATGDIGRLDDEGYLTITDRKKDIIVTAGGKNVAPQPIEAALMEDPLIDRAVVIGDRRKYLVALVVPDFQALRAWAAEQGLRATSPEELVQDHRVVALYNDVAQRRTARFASYETVKKVALLERDLDEASGELTPTLKVKRRVIAERFAPLIESLYAEDATRR